MQRFFLTCAIGLGLMAALQLYAQLISPLTIPLEKPKLPPRTTGTVQLSSAASQAAQSWLASEAWIQTASKKWQRSEQSFLFSETIETVKSTNAETGDNNLGDTVRMKPFAMIWKDPHHPDSPPLTVVAESARIRFENAIFDLSSSENNAISLTGNDQGRIVSAALEGRIRMTGPDGLVVEGQDFVFIDEAESAQLYSDFPVNFWYGPAATGQSVQVRGSSALGLLVQFDHDPNSPWGQDMPAISEIPRTAELRGRVVVEFLPDGPDHHQRTRVTSEGPFGYEFATSTATFRDEVLVNRPVELEHRDEIECNLLALVFGAITPSSASGGPDIQPVKSEEVTADHSPRLLTQLELKHIRALANPNPRAESRDRVTLRSTLNGIECELDDLQYDAAKRMFTLTDPDRVDVWRDVGGQAQKLEAPKIEIRHTADQKLELLSAVGTGQMIHRTDAKSQGVADLWGRWKDRLDLIPSGEHDSTEVTLRGQTTVGQLDQMQFSSQTLTAWLPRLDEVNIQPEASLKGRGRHSTKSDPEAVPVRRILAIGNVSFVAPGLVGRRIDQVDIRVGAGQIVPVTQPEQSRQNQTTSGLEENGADASPFVFECQRITGNAVFDPSLRQIDVSQLNGFEGVRVFRATESPGQQQLPFEEQAIRVSAREFVATNAGGIRQTLTLRGATDEQGNVLEPVVARLGEFFVEGPKLTIDRERNLVTVEVDRSLNPNQKEAQVVLRFPVDRDFSGNVLNPPVLADIACLEKITFDGQQATFLQSVKASLLDSKVRAEEMTAVLNRRIDFGDLRPDKTSLAINRMTCKDKVSVEMYQYAPQQELVEILRARFHHFAMDQLTGKFHGQGPGKIEDWRRTGTRRMLVQSKGTAQSNRPADSHGDYPWEYVSIQFEGGMDGNVQDRWGKLNDRVQLMYAPVKNAYLTFKRDDLSGDEKNASNAVWVGSEQLTVGLSGDSEKKQSPTATIEALENAEMEGRNFNAFAYSLQYEQAKEMFTLLGKGREKATLNVQPSLNEAPKKLSAQTIRIFPSKQEVSVDRAQSFTTTFGGE